MVKSSSNDNTNWWFYFTKVPINRASCNHCPWEEDRGESQGTGKLRHHLETKHPEIYREKLGAEEAKNKSEVERKRKHDVALEKQRSFFKPKVNEDAGSSKQPNRNADELSVKELVKVTPKKTYPIFCLFFIVKQKIICIF